MTMRPDFSPSMLSLFLRARAAYAASAHSGAGKRAQVVATFKARMRRMARLTCAELDMAWMGRLARPEPRVRLWAVLGHFPSDHGVMLTHGGQRAFLPDDNRAALRNHSGGHP